MARGKVHPLEKRWKVVFEGIKMPCWLPWYVVELRKFSGGIEVGGLKVEAAGEEERLEVAKGVVNIIRENEAMSAVFIDALKESVGGCVPVPARWFNLMSERWFYPDKTLDDVDEEDRVDEGGRPRCITTSKGLMLTSREERDYIDEENRKVEIDEENRASASREER